MILTFGNFKGGVGKTTSSAVISYLLSQNKSNKVLVIDTDPQRNLTDNLLLTFDKEIDNQKNIFNACLSNMTIYESIQSLSSNLDIIAGTWNMIDFENKAKELFRKESLQHIISKTIEPIKEQYDFIIIDTAPATNLVMNNAVVATDYVLIATQTTASAFDSTKKYYSYLEEMNSIDDSFELLGILPYLVGKSTTGKKLLLDYREFFGTDLFENVIRRSDRVETWISEGITEHKPHDKNTLQMYSNVLEEALLKIEANQKENI